MLVYFEDGQKRYIGSCYCESGQAAADYMNENGLHAWVSEQNATQALVIISGKRENAKRSKRQFAA